MQQGATIKALQVLHRAMLLGQVIMAAGAVFLIYYGKFTPVLTAQDKVFQLLALAVSFGAAFTGYSIFKKKVQAARDHAGSVQMKADLYRTACIILWAMLEGAGLFCIVCFMLVGNLSYLLLAAALMFLFFTNGPSKNKIMIQLRLSETDWEEF